MKKPLGERQIEQTTDLLVKVHGVTVDEVERLLPHCPDGAIKATLEIISSHLTLLGSGAYPDRVADHFALLHAEGFTLRAAAEALPKRPLLEALTEAPLNPQVLSTSVQEAIPPAEQPIVYMLGHRRYRVGNSRVIAVSDTEDDVLNAFFFKPVMSGKDLRKDSKQPDAVRILRRLKTKKSYDQLFDAAIRMPGQKGAGGYSVVVKDPPPEKE